MFRNKVNFLEIYDLEVISNSIYNIFQLRMYMSGEIHL